MLEKWNGLGEGKDRQLQLQLHIKPAYVQLDHVYGLQNLNEASVAADTLSTTQPTVLISSNKKRFKPTTNRRSLQLTPAILSASNRVRGGGRSRRMISFLADSKPSTSPILSSLVDSDSDDSLGADTTTGPGSSETSSVWAARDAAVLGVDEGVDEVKKQKKQDIDDAINPLTPEWTVFV